jgi:hypothetical protein
MTDFIIGIGPIIVGLAGIIFGYIFNIRMMKRQNHEDERKEIYKKLNAFYGPFQQRLEKTHELYGIFTDSRELEFRTLTALLKGTKFVGNDKILLEEILKINAEMEKLIIVQSGLIDDASLRQLLAKAGTHFRILDVIYRNDTQGDSQRFKSYIFPKELGTKIEDEIQKLKQRLNEINAI